MRRFTSFRFHVLLFGLAAAGTLLTWTREVSYDEDESAIRIWDRDSADVRLVHFQNEEIDLRIERRTDGSGEFLWGIQIGGMDDGPDSLSFPVGPPGNALVGRIAGLRALREMGTLSPELQEELGIAGSNRRLVVRFTDEERELTLGDRVFGLTDEYAYEAATGLGYVLSREVVEPLSRGEGNVRERWVHRFGDSAVAEVRVEAGGRVRTMLPRPDGEWTELPGGAADPAFATFMQRVAQLAIDGYYREPAADGVTTIVRLDYIGHDGEPIGFLELTRDDSEPDLYFLRSETTRIPAQAMGFLAQRVEEALSGAFSGAAGRAPSPVASPD